MPTVQGETIAIYIPDLSGGGAELVSVRLANELVAMGRPVDLVLNQAQGILLAQVASGVGIVDLRAARTFAAIRPLRRYLREARPRALIANLLYNNLVALLAAPLGRWRGRLIVCQHNTISVQSKLTIKDRFFSAVFALALRYADNVVAVSQDVADDLSRYSRLPRRRVDVIYNPIVTSDFHARAAEPADHAWLSDKRSPVFVAVGRLVPQKDYPLLLTALARLQTSHSAKLIVLGEGPLRAELVRVASDLSLTDHVDFVGFRSNPLPFIARARALVLCSRYEGFGNVLAEAMACGTPVVSTACNGPREILDDGRFGVLVPVGDVRALAAAMADVLKAARSPQLLRQGAERFRSDIVAKRYLDLTG